jgi:two-component system, sensor histidine kinase and response regulator
MLTVLVADDEFAVLEVMSVALAGAGYRVLKAGDGIDALRILISQPCDLIVTDETMPGLSGHQLIAAIQAEPRLADLQVVLMADTWGRELPVIEGVTVLGKPVVLAALVAAVERALASRRRG